MYNFVFIMYSCVSYCMVCNFYTTIGALSTPAHTANRFTALD
jgi:hypothetical protein